MKVNIHFYINNEESTELFSIFDATFNPFKLGDDVSLDVQDLGVTELDQYPISLRNGLIEKNEEMQKEYRLKVATIIKEGKYMRYSAAGAGYLTIEYYCNIKDWEKL